MTEKIGFIKNPLTIIAIFAGIAEVSGTIVLPFISEPNQRAFIFFLIFFPSILVILFFITLNFNNRVLYAPSDYKDEMNYIKINKYDVAQQEIVEMKVLKEDPQGQQIIQLSEKIEYLRRKYEQIETSIVKEGEGTKAEDDYIETIGVKFLVSYYENVEDYINYMTKIGINFEIYRSTGDGNSFASFEMTRAIWLGEEVPIKLAQLVIKNSVQFYPHLKYISLIGKDLNSDSQIYIGGSTKTAVKKFNSIPLQSRDFKHLETLTDQNSFHDYIKKFRK